MKTFTMPRPTSLVRGEDYDYLAINAESRGKVLEFQPSRWWRDRAGMGAGCRTQSTPATAFLGHHATSSQSSSRRSDGTYNNGPEEKYWNWPLLVQGAFWLVLGAVIYFARK